MPKLFLLFSDVISCDKIESESSSIFVGSVVFRSSNWENIDLLPSLSWIQESQTGNPGACEP